jgi:hypothetical protein
MLTNFLLLLLTPTVLFIWLYEISHCSSVVRASSLCVQPYVWSSYSMGLPVFPSIVIDPALEFHMLLNVFNIYVIAEIDTGNSTSVAMMCASV